MGKPTSIKSPLEHAISMYGEFGQIPIEIVMKSVEAAYKAGALDALTKQMAPSLREAIASDLWEAHRDGGFEK